MFRDICLKCILETDEPREQAEEGNENLATIQGACGTSANANRGNGCNAP